MKFLLNTLMISLVLFASCTEEDPQTELSSEEMLAGLTSKNWALTAQVTFQDGKRVDGGGALDCETDNIFTFNSDGNYTMNEGVTKCDYDDPSQVSGLWTFSDDYTKLFVYANNIQTMYTVISLSADRLQVEETTYWYVLNKTFLKK